MPLLSLPPEIMQQVFSLIDPSFFYQDLGRLTICKQWIDFALPLCLSNIVITQRNIQRFVDSGSVIVPSVLSANLETLRLELDEMETSTIDASTPPKPTANIINNLTALVSLIQQSHRLKTLHIQAWPSRPEYQWLPTIKEFLSTESLTSLNLDLTIGLLPSFSHQEDEESHICPEIGALLGNLETLQLRLHRICPEALKPRDSAKKQPLQLSTVIINLSLDMDIPGRTWAYHTRHCKVDNRTEGLVHLKSAIQNQAEALVSQMASPKTFHILTHTLPSFKVQSLNVLTGETTVIRIAELWDEDNRSVEGASSSESELSDGAMAAFLDDDD